MTSIPVAIFRLLRAHIDSVEKLDVLLTLGTAPDRSLPLDLLARSSRLPLVVARRLATELEASGLVVMYANHAARLEPARESDQSVIDALIAHHELDRQAILDALMGRPR